MNMHDTVTLLEPAGGQTEVSRTEAMCAVARMAEAIIDSARRARSGSEQELLLDQARMLRAISYFALRSRREFRWERGVLHGTISIDPSIVGSYKGGSDEAVDLLLRDLRDEMVREIAMRRDEEASR